MPKRLCPRSRSPAHSPRPAPPLTAQLVDWACRPPFGYPNPRSVPEGPLPRGLEPQRRGLGTPLAPAQDSPCHPAATQAARGAAGHSGWEMAGPSEPLASFEGPPRQNAWAHAPAHHYPHLGPPRHLPHSRHIRPAGLLGANPNPRLVLEGHFQGAWLRTPGIGDPRAPALDSPCRPATTQADRAAARHSGWENGQVPPSPRELRRPPFTKRLGLCSCLPAPSPRPAPPFAPQPVDRACRPPFGYPNPRWAP